MPRLPVFLNPHKATIILDKPKYLLLRSKLLAEEKTFSQWLREKIEEELES